MAFWYAGPDQIMPIATFLGTVFGVAMIFWNKLLRVLARIGGLFSRARSENHGGSTAPVQHEPMLSATECRQVGPDGASALRPTAVFEDGTQQKPRE